MKKLLSFAFALMATTLIPLAAQVVKVLTVYFSYSGNTKTVAEQIHKNI
ncbi:MAG: hypothetical protein LE178_06445 [Endomicrobium sp.]|jgi:hypothetical protein|nr:hypothetical protein [Endomicrobium sp.]